MTGNTHPRRPLVEQALAELDKEFPGVDFDDSMREYVAKKARAAKLRKLIIKRCTPLFVVLVFGLICFVGMLKSDFLSLLIYPVFLLSGLVFFKE